MIRLKDFSIGFGQRTLLENINDEFSAHKMTALIGRNGTGKSTLLKTICGLNKIYSGEIFINGENLKKISGRKLATELAYVNTQRPRMANLRCIDVVALGRSPYTGWNGKLSRKDWEKVDHAIEMVGMAEYKNRYFNSLSDGESQKVMIARALAQDTGIIILDEPTSFLDLPTRHELVSFLKNISREKGKTIIYSTHELDIALKYSDFIAILKPPRLTIKTPREIDSESIF